MSNWLQNLLGTVGHGVVDVGRGVGKGVQWMYDQDPDVQRARLAQQAYQAQQDRYTQENLERRQNAAELLRERLFGEARQTAQDDRQSQIDQQNLTQRNFENARQTNSDITSGLVQPVAPALTIQNPQPNPTLAQTMLGVTPGRFNMGGVTSPSPDELDNPSVYAVPGGGDARYRPSTPAEYQTQQNAGIMAKARAEDAANTAILNSHFQSPEFQSFAKDNPEQAQAAVVKARFGVEPTKLTLDNLGAQYMQKYQQTRDPKYLGLYHQIYPTKSDESAVDPQYLKSLVNTTASGRPWFNAEDFKGDKAGFAAAMHSGTPVLNPTDAGNMKDISYARRNMDFMLNDIQDALAPDAQGRILTAPSNKLAEAMQTNPKLASIGTYRNAAIASMRAVAGSKGLRINQYEVQMAIDNDIPKDTDTVAVAQKTLANMKAFLENSERAHLVRDQRTQNEPADGSTARPTMIRVKEKSTGRMGTLPANEFDPTKFEKQ
jgi:hypothetical protein